MTPTMAAQSLSPCFYESIHIWAERTSYGRDTEERIQQWFPEYRAGFLGELWHALHRPSPSERTLFAADPLSGGGFLAGIVFGGGLNTAMEAASEKRTYIDCHKGIAHKLPVNS